MPGVTRQNVGTCTPGDLLSAVALFDGKYGSDG